MLDEISCDPKEILNGKKLNHLELIAKVKRKEAKETQLNETY